MRSPLFWKLLLLQLAAAAILLAGALAVMRLYTAYNFNDFMQASEQQRLQEIAAQLAREVGAGATLAEAAARMRPLPGRGPQDLPPEEQNDQPRGPPPEQMQDAGAPGPGPEQFQNQNQNQNQNQSPPQNFGPLGQPPPRLRRGPPPLSVYDEQDQLVWGNGNTPPQGDMSAPVMLGGRSIGRVARPRVQGPPLSDQLRFERQQLRGLAVVGGCAMALAAILAALIAGIVLKPLRVLSRGVTALAQRDFSTRLDVSSGDELGRLAADFNKLSEALERYDQRQRQWLADIAHELRTPLAILRGELEAVLDGVRQLDSNSARSLHQEALRLARLVDDLHLLSMAESGGLELRRVMAPVGALAEATAARFTERYTARGFKLLTIVADRKLAAAIDPQRIDQVMANLLENALRHANPPGPVRLSVSQTGQQVSIVVADAGPGVPDALLPKLFDRLYRADPARSRAAGGAGLGLAICKSIVEAHGGSIAARREGRGLMFEILLPLQ